MTGSWKVTMCIAATALLAFVCHAAIGASSDNDGATASAVTVDADGADTASIPDFDGDGTIGFGDFLIFAAVFGARHGDEKYKPTFDLNGDGEIGFSDFVIFAQNFGKDAPSPVVTIPDANLRAAIERALGKSSGAPITQAEMSTLDSLTARGENISDLTGLEYASNLQALILWRNDLADVSALTGLTNLSVLQLGGNNLTDVTALAMLKNLRSLDLRGNNITDISPLSDLANLTSLNLSGNKIANTSVLADLINLRYVDLKLCDISDVTELAGLINLELLNLSYNNITDVSPLSGLSNLTLLSLVGSNLTDLTTLSNLTNLSSLFLDGNNVSDVSALSNLTNLTWLNLGGDFGGNMISDVSVLSGLTKLRRLELAFNQISDITSLTGLADLVDLDLRGNPLSDSSIDDHIPILEASGVAVDYLSIYVGDFDIEFVFLGHFTDGYKNLLKFAARRWMSVITEDLPELGFDNGWSGQCGGHSFEIPPGERIDDLRIYVASNFEPENPHGWASEMVLRETTNLPALGCMVIRFGGYNTVTNVWITGLHELGHVVGFSRQIWKELGYLEDPFGDPHFNGPMAIAAFDDAGGRDYVGAKVPVDGSHWRWPVFQGELMVGGGGGALSAITVQSLADIGHGVDLSQVDPYALPGATAGAKIAVATPADPGIGVNTLRPDVYALSGANPARQGKIGERLLSIVGNDGREGPLASAERMWGRGMTFDLAESRMLWDAGSPARTAPELTCGAGLMNEPIYVVNQQGRIVRTIER